MPNWGLKAYVWGRVAGGILRIYFIESYTEYLRFLERIIGIFGESSGMSIADQGRVMQNRGENIRGVIYVGYGGEFWGESDGE